MLLKPQLRVIAIDPAARQSVEDAVFGALFEHVDRYLPSKSKQPPSIALIQAEEILAATLPKYRETVATGFDGGIAPAHTVDPAAETRQLFELGVAGAIGYLRREGATALRGALSADPAEGKAALWRALFQNRLRSVIEGAGYLLDREKRESCDLAVECLRLWSANLFEQLLPLAGAEWSPSQLFLDPEIELDGVIEWKGRELRLRGRPEALIVNPVADPPEIAFHDFDLPGQTELQIAQMALSRALVTAVRGPGVDACRLHLFQLTPQDSEGASSSSPFPPRVKDAFSNYVGNSAAARRVMIEATVALKSNDGCVPVNLLFCGPDGIGKTELARCVARALGNLPLVRLNAADLKTVDDLFEAVDRELEKTGRVAEEAGSDSGMPRLRYPPLVILIDDLHLLGKRAPAFVNLFDPEEKRAAGRKIVGEFPLATILAATPEKDRVASELLPLFRLIDLVPYTMEEAGQIVRLSFDGLTAEPAFFETLAAMSRLNPGAASQRASEFLARHRADPGQFPLSPEGLDRIAKEAWKVDRLGLAQNDRAYLEALGDGPKGFGALATILPFRKQAIQTDIEPYLIQLGLVRATTSGRKLTEKGRLYLVGA